MMWISNFSQYIILHFIKASYCIPQLPSVWYFLYCHYDFGYIGVDFV